MAIVAIDMVMDGIIHPWITGMMGIRIMIMIILIMIMIILLNIITMKDQKKEHAIPIRKYRNSYI